MLSLRFALTALFFLAPLFPVCFADVQEIAFATAGQSTVILTGNWTRELAFLPQTNGSTVEGSVVVSHTTDDSIFVQIPRALPFVSAYFYEGLSYSHSWD